MLRDNFSSATHTQPWTYHLAAYLALWHIFPGCYWIHFYAFYCSVLQWNTSAWLPVSAAEWCTFSGVFLPVPYGYTRYHRASKIAKEVRIFVTKSSSTTSTIFQAYKSRGELFPLWDLVELLLSMCLESLKSPELSHRTSEYKVEQDTCIDLAQSQRVG